jgi:Na+/H+ antiporter NhaD/arsenite permease-like protein
MDLFVSLVFILVYLGMILGRIPPLALDRAGLALLGAIALLASGAMDTAALGQAVDLPTLALLFGLMVVSAQFRLGGFYSWLAGRLALAGVSPPGLLALLIAAAGALSALLVNDVVCLAFTPVLIEGCRKRGLNAKPFLLALACAANLGSAATLIGNPQNMLIGQVLHLSFAGYLADGLPPTLLGLGVVWLVVAVLYRRRWWGGEVPPPVAAPAFDAWQTGKGALVLAALVAAFLFTPWPREVLALAAAGLLLTSRHMASRRMLGLVDWQLLVLFVGLFAVNHAMEGTGEPRRALAWLAAAGLDLAQPGWLFAATVALSNLVSNVPAVMLLLPSASHPQAGPLLALASTLAGNLLLVGSIANLIVVEQAATLGIGISWREHARVGVPVTLVSLALAGLWLWLRLG